MYHLSFHHQKTVPIFVNLLGFNCGKRTSPCLVLKKNKNKQWAQCPSCIKSQGTTLNNLLGFREYWENLEISLNWNVLGQSTLSFILLSGVHLSRGRPPTARCRVSLQTLPLFGAAYLHRDSTEPWSCSAASSCLICSTGRTSSPMSTWTVACLSL